MAFPTPGQGYPDGQGMSHSTGYFDGIKFVGATSGLGRYKTNLLAYRYGWDETAGTYVNKAFGKLAKLKFYKETDTTFTDADETAIGVTNRQARKNGQMARVQLRYDLALGSSVPARNRVKHQSTKILVPTAQLEEVASGAKACVYYDKYNILEVEIG
jgi:hypothetical protein